MFRKLVMGLAEKMKEQEARKTPDKLTNSEIDFVLNKLRTATFLGEEFEQFYNVWVKLSEMKSK